MCGGALLLARLARVVYGLGDGKMGALGGRLNLGTVAEFNHSLEIQSGVMAAECGALLQTFFRLRRRNHV